MPRVDASPDLAARLAPIELQSTEGRSVALGELWRTGPAVLVHLRHFG